MQNNKFRTKLKSNPLIERNHMFDRLQELCKKSGTSVTALCKEITGSTGNYATWKNGNIRNDYLLKIADYFGVSTDYLLGKTDTPNLTAPTTIDAVEAVRIALHDMLGRDPTIEELKKFKQLAEVFFDNLNDNEQ